jgi:hypothetical protein
MDMEKATPWGGGFQPLLLEVQEREAPMERSHGRTASMARARHGENAGAEAMREGNGEERWEGV